MYLLTKTFFVSIYLICICYNAWFYLAPVIATHGIPKMIAVFLITTLITGLCTFGFLTTNKPNKPQATPKSWANPKDYQDYLDTISPTGDIHD